MNKTQWYKTEIIKKLGGIQRSIEDENFAEQYDINRHMEDVVCALLNLAYGYHLENLNLKKKNHPAVDLGDVQEKLAVQVSTDSKRSKIADALTKFEDHGLSAEYTRLIIFLLKGRQSYSGSFETASLKFSAKDDIWDFVTLKNQIMRCDHETLKKIYEYLEREYPTPGKNTIWIKTLCIAAVVALVFLISSVIFRHYREANPRYAYETVTDWMTMDEVACVLGSQNKSQARMFTGEQYLDEFMSGSALTVLYNNLDEQDRIIEEFTVYAEDIVEDLSPRLLFNAITSSDNQDIYCTYSFFNYGWGETGEITVNFVGLTRDEDTGGGSQVQLFLKEDSPRTWSLPSILPGEWPAFELLGIDDFYVEDSCEPDYSVSYTLEYEFLAPESNFRMDLIAFLDVTPEGLTISAGGGGAGDERTYVVWVETGSPAWSKTYKTHQVVPGNQTVRLPIFIVPQKSCTMTVTVEFKTADGEIIRATPLENAEYIIPFYEDESTYVDGLLLDWDEVDGETIVFPFKSTPFVVKEGE